MQLLAKAEGKYKGRQCNKYDQVLLKEVLSSLANNCMTVTEASKKLGVTRATVYNLLKKIGGTPQWNYFILSHGHSNLMKIT